MASSHASLNEHIPGKTITYKLKPTKGAAPSAPMSVTLSAAKEVTMLKQDMDLILINSAQIKGSEQGFSNVASLMESDNMLTTAQSEYSHVRFR